MLEKEHKFPEISIWHDDGKDMLYGYTRESICVIQTILEVIEMASLSDDQSICACSKQMVFCKAHQHFITSQWHDKNVIEGCIERILYSSLISILLLL